MATTTTTTSASAIATIFQPGITKTFYQGTPFLNFLGWPFPQNAGGNSIDWKLAYSSGTASLLSEGDALPAPINEAYADMTIASQLIVDVVQITGHVRDAARGGYFDAAQRAMDNGVSALLHKCEEYTVSQLESAIDDSSTYAGQTRATVGATSDVTAGNSANPTEAVLSEMYETLQLDPRAVVYDPTDHFIFSSPEQLTNYTQLVGLIKVGDDESTGVNSPYGMNQGDAVLDIGKMKHSHRYNNLPWYAFPTVTNTLIFLARRSDIIVEQFAPVQIIPLARNDDSDTYEIRCHIGVAYRDPYRAGRIETLTT